MNTGAESQYLDRVLRMNPLTDADEIVVAREAFLNPDAPVEGLLDDEANLHEARRRAAKELDGLRALMWIAPPEQLDEWLAALQHSRFADVAAAAWRLRAVAKARPEFERLQADRACDSRLVHALRTIVVSSAHDAANVRKAQLRRLNPETETALSDSSDPNLPPVRVDRLGEAALRNEQSFIQETALRIRHAYPRVFALEPTLIGGLIRRKSLAEVEKSNAAEGCMMLLAILTALAGSVGVVYYVFYT